MAWSGECSVGLEFKSIYQSRMSQLKDRFALPGVVPIAQVSDNNVHYCISGILKRLESRRLRAFEKEYQQKYNGDAVIYSEHDELEIEDETGKLKLTLVSC